MLIPDEVVANLISVRSFSRKNRRTTLSTRTRSRRQRTRLQIESLEQRRLLATLVVTSIADSGVGSLRQAIIDSNASIGIVDSIEFNIAGPGPHTIAPATPLPAIVDRVIINGFTQADTIENNNSVGQAINAVLQIELAGDLAGPNANGLRLAAGSQGSEIRGLAINRFSGAGILVESSGNKVAANFIGTNITGTSSLANGPGVQITASNNTIGGLLPADRNVISGNVTGITLLQANDNAIAGNLIGTDVTGNSRLANSTGIQLVGASNNLIGGNSTAARNIISGNDSIGIEFLNSSSGGSLLPPTNNRVQGNYIGLNVGGTAALPGQHLGGGVILGGIENLLGGSLPGQGNVIAGNQSNGVRVANRNTVQGNLIGTAADGVVAVPNSDNGVQLLGSMNAIIGGSTPAAGNVIAGNTAAGIEVINDIGSFIEHNRIGIGLDSSSIGNGAAGIEVLAIDSTNLQLTVRSNTIAHNLDDGVRVSAANEIAHTGVHLIANSIFANAGLGIDLGDDGATFNDVDDADDADQGANGLQNYPVITSATSAATTQIEGTLHSSPLSNFRIEFFANRQRKLEFVGNQEQELDLAGRFSEGELFLGSIEVSTDAAGMASFSASGLTAINTTTPFITATATDITLEAGQPRGNTSEFSAVFPLGGLTTTVTSTADQGLGTLREAIFNANLNPELRERIEFEIPANDPRHLYYRNDGLAGQVSTTQISVTIATDDSTIADIDPDWPHSWFSIQLESDLPAVTDPVIIDGYTQTGSVQNTLVAPAGLDSIIKIEIDGSQSDTAALRLAGLGVSTVSGLAINRSPGHGIESNAGGGDQVYGNYIGTDVSGTLDLGNGRSGIALRSQVMEIGGAEPAQRNLISGNAENGIFVDRSIGTNIFGNLIGSDRSAQRNLGNDFDGIQIDYAYLITIGGDVTGQANLIAGNARTGIRYNPFTSTQPQGSDAEGEGTSSEIDRLKMSIAEKQDLERRIKIVIFTFGVIPQVILGELLEDLENCLDESERELRRLNSEGNNHSGNSHGGGGSSAPSGLASGEANLSQGLAIDLGNDGVTPNDDDKLLEGSNGLQNYPVLSSATSDNGATTVAGTLNSHVSQTFRIDFYASRVLHVSGHGPGEQPLGFTLVTTDENGNASFSFTPAVAVPDGRFITSLATLLLDLDDDLQTPLDLIHTSEFSAGIIVGSGAQQLDFGDAPDRYPVSLAQDGARHSIGTLFLGASVDDEVDGDPSAAADSDGGDDGVTLIASLFKVTGAASNSSFQIVASQSGKLDGWIDFNADGDWTDTGEQVFTGVNVAVGANVLNFAVPTSATVGNTFARFRLSTAGSLAPTGAAADGEVEDYLYTIVDGDSSAGVTITIVDGSLRLTLDDDENVVRSGATELFRALAENIELLQVNGTATDDTISIDFASGFTVPANGLQIDGGAGTNTLTIEGAGELDFTDPKNSLRNLGAIVLPTTAINTIKIDRNAVNQLSPSTKSLRISSGLNDTIDVVDRENWRLVAPKMEGSSFVLSAQNQLGDSEMIEVAGGRPFRNFLQVGDVNNSGTVTAGDALEIIFELNRRFVSNTDGDLVDPTSLSPWPGFYQDVNGDGRVTAADALAVINILFLQSMNSGEGEASVPASLLSVEKDFVTTSKDYEPQIPETRTHSKQITVAASVQTIAANQRVNIDEIMQLWDDTEESESDLDMLFWP